MKTNVSFLKKTFDYPSDKSSVTCTINAVLSLDNNPVLRAVVKDDIKQINDMLAIKSAEQFNGSIYFTVVGKATHKEGDENDIVEARHIAEDKAQAKAIDKAWKIYHKLSLILHNHAKFSSERAWSLAVVTDNMYKHVEELTQKTETNN